MCWVWHHAHASPSEKWEDGSPLHLFSEKIGRRMKKTRKRSQKQKSTRVHKPGVPSQAGETRKALRQAREGARGNGYWFPAPRIPDENRVSLVGVNEDLSLPKAKDHSLISLPLQWHQCFHSWRRNSTPYNAFNSFFASHGTVPAAENSTWILNRFRPLQFFHELMAFFWSRFGNGIKIDLWTMKSGVRERTYSISTNT